MKHFLVIEDNKPETLGNLLVEHFQDAKVKIASSVEESNAVMEGMRKSFRTFDAIVVDLSLPQKPSAPEEIQYVICRTARDSFPDAFIVIYSQYLQSPEFRAQLDLLEDYADAMVDKNEDDAEERLIRLVRERPLLRRLHELFDAPSRQRRLAHRSSGYVRSGTMEATIIASDIMSYWDDLSPEAKEDVEHYLKVEKDDSGVKFHYIR